MDKKEKIHLLEKTILDLGTEIFHLQQKFKDLSFFQDEFVKTMEGLRQVLDEQNLCSKDDFNTAIDLEVIIKNMNTQIDLPDGFLERKSKKIAH